MNIKELDLDELKRRREIVIWQISIAKCWEILAEKQTRLAQLNTEIELRENNNN